ncbi:MAG: Gfo/Idh/MocA family oxidoreductase [Bradyrhizobium sp.]|nr:Gfo/Idh/MocA family oxidoreductase [Bradyrhizobium sp.]
MVSADGQLRTAVIGVGHLGQHHARVHAESPSTRLVAIVDLDLARAREVGERFGVEARDNFASLVGEVDAVSIVVPTEYHAATARPFLEAGTAVLLEKPMVNRIADGEALVELANKQGVVLQVGHIERFNPAFAAVAELALKPRYIDCLRQSPFPFRSLDVSVVFDIMIHDLDIAAHLAGAPVARVDAVGAEVITKSEDIASARIAFENGVVANVSASRISLESTRLTRIFCDDCIVTIDYQARSARIYRRSDRLLDAMARVEGEGPSALTDLKECGFESLIEGEDIPVREQDQLEAEIGAFLRCVRTGERPLVSGEDGLGAVRLATRIVEDIAKAPFPRTATTGVRNG